MTPSFGPYRVIQSLGSGGMADVYLAHDAGLNRRVAIKAPRPEFITAEGRARFAREAMAAAALEHVAIVPLYGYGDQDGRPYMVMRYLTGGSLAERISRRPMHPAAALPILERIAAALDYAHSHGVIHRDVKSANILFDDKDNAYLSDFGIAWLAAAGETNRLTATGTVRGTFDYISPEQAQGIRDLDGRADLYSLAVVLFEMLTGDVPYRADSGLLVAAQHISAPVPDIRSRRPDLPPALSAVMGRALAKRRDDRYPTGAALVADVGRALSGQRVATPQLAPSHPAPAVSGSPINRITWLLIIGAVAALAVVMFALLRPSGSGSEAVVATAELQTPNVTDTTEPTSTITAIGETPTLVGIESTSITAPAQLTNTLTPTYVPPHIGDNRIIPLSDEVSIEQVFVPAGSFLMGSLEDPEAKGNEYPQHEVYIDAFWLDKTEVTNGQFEVFIKATGYQTAAERENSGRVRTETGWLTVPGVNWEHPSDPVEALPDRDFPVVMVSWDDATAFCTWAGGRLPTEAEWEYAARGSTAERYPWGDEFVGEFVNFCDLNCPFSWADLGLDDSFETIAPVGSFANGASWVGAFDLVGNVWEWVNDWYTNGYYEDAPYANPTGPDVGDFRVLRGGAWYNLAETVRGAERGSDRPVDRDNGAGFRCAAAATGAAALTAPAATVILTATLPAAPAVLPGALVLDAFSDGGAVNGAYRVNAPGNELSLALVPAGDGQALALTYRINNGPPGDYAGIERDLAAMDWRGYSEICLWVRNDDFDGRLTVQFRQRAADTWKTAVPLAGVTTANLCLPLNEATFTAVSGDAAATLDLAEIDNYAIYLGDGRLDQGTLLVDAIRLNP